MEELRLELELLQEENLAQQEEILAVRPVFTCVYFFLAS